MSALPFALPPRAVSTTVRSNGNKFEWIEAARGVAALAVVLMHAANLMDVPHFSGHIGLGGAFNFGYVGVDFFFVLSGFVITHAHRADIGRPSTIPLYLWRRFSRIYPIFWVSLALAVTVSVVGRRVLGHNEPFGFTTTDFFGTVLLIKIAEPKFIGVAWSLQYEVMFYLLFVVALVRLEWAQWMLLAWVIGIILRWCGVIDTGLRGLLSGHTFQFILGSFVALAAHRWAAPRAPVRGLGWAAVALVGVVIAERTLWQPHSDVGRVAMGLASAAVVYFLVALDKSRAVRAPRLLSRLGSVSYSVYLTHIIFITIAYRLLAVTGLYARLPEALNYALAVACALGCSALLGRWVELPIVSLMRQVVRRKPA